ncbi:MAG: PIN domain-containing protein [Pseudolabrys sp.]|nr:PIN domain-containing protein [Pseudolabrys sp.]MSP31237.1 PIN domain-containing protein [Pseudolabrys sp.]
MSRFLDTNILLYSISRDPYEAAKRDIAIGLLDQQDNALSVQVLQEFYVQATRSTRPDALPHDLATGLIRTWLRFPVQDITLSVMSHALDIKNQHGLSYWDAAIVAAARAIDCNVLLTEDLTDSMNIEGLRIENPFR